VTVGHARFRRILRPHGISTFASTGEMDKADEAEVTMRRIDGVLGK